MIRIEPKYKFNYDGVVVNIYHANKGEGLPKHSHMFAHATMCHAGKCAIRKEGKQIYIDKNHTPINLIAHEWHEIIAIEDGTIFVNIFAEGKD